MPFLAALTRSFEDHPPLRRIAAAMAGVKPKKRADDLGELIAMFPQGVIR
jgi:hypothetical protein